MKTLKYDYTIAWLTLLSGLCISGVAMYYSVAGLMGIFAGAAIPIMIMGIFLEISKLIATLWLKRYWSVAPIVIKTYLCISIAILMFITSVGVYGYLSRAHADQAIPAGDVIAQVQVFDDQIAMHKENIMSAKTAISQLNRVVDETMSRSDNTQGAANSNVIRRAQTKERQTLQESISESQKEISRLTKEKAPIASSMRVVEAEIGPIKYIAALLYGDNLDSALLDKAVRAIIIMIVIVFDPLAVVLLLTSQYSFQYISEKKKFVPEKKMVSVTQSESESESDLDVAPVVTHDVNKDANDVWHHEVPTEEQVDKTKEDVVESPDSKEASPVIDTKPKRKAFNSNGIRKKK